MHPGLKIKSLKIFLLFLAVMLTCSWSFLMSQTPSDTLKGKLMPAKIENGDTIVLANLDEITIPSDSKPIFESKRAERNPTCCAAMTETYMRYKN